MQKNIQVEKKSAFSYCSCACCQFSRQYFPSMISPCVGELCSLNSAPAIISHCHLSSPEYLRLGKDLYNISITNVIRDAYNMNVILILLSFGTKLLVKGCLSLSEFGKLL
jgi:hypothetical protein